LCVIQGAKVSTVKFLVRTFLPITITTVNEQLLPGEYH
jgi:hypothetical protein